MSAATSVPNMLLLPSVKEEEEQRVPQLPAEDAVTNLPEDKSPAFARRNLESMMGEGAGAGEEEGDREAVGEGERD